MKAESCFGGEIPFPHENDILVGLSGVIGGESWKSATAASEMGHGAAIQIGVKAEEL